MYITSDLTWSVHCEQIITKSNRRLCAFWKLKKSGVASSEILLSQAIRRKNPPNRGTIPFCLYIAPTDLVNVFLDVGNLQITYMGLYIGLYIGIIDILYIGLYADDAKLFKTITSPGDCKKLQEAVTCIDDLGMKSNMKFNATKFKVLSVTSSRSPLLANYHIGSDEVIRVSSEVDLGIILTSNLTWNSHIDKIVAKANKMLGLLRRTCPLSTNCDGRRTLYLSLVKSLTPQPGGE